MPWRGGHTAKCLGPPHDPITYWSRRKMPWTTMRGRLAHKVLKWREDNFSRHDNLLQNWWGIIFLIYHQFITKHHHHIGCPTEKLVEPVVYFCVLVKFLNIIIIIHFSIIFIIRGQRSRGYQIPPNISNTYYWVTYQSVLGDEGSTVT